MSENHIELDRIGGEATKAMFHRHNLNYLQSAIACFLANNMSPEETAEILEAHAKQLREWG